MSRPLRAFAFAMATISPAATALGGSALTLVYDDSRNPIPFAQVYYCANINPGTGNYAADWSGFARYPMFDDGQHGDGQAGDHVWGVKLTVNPLPGQLFEWATDFNEAGDDGWLGPSTPFVVEEDGAEITVSGRSMPEEAFTTPEQFMKATSADLSRANSPVRLANSDSVLFTFEAPEGTRCVYLATAANNWASRDPSGAVRDGRTAMFRAGTTNIWYTVLDLQADRLSYRYAIQTEGGGFQWVRDPLVSASDGGMSSRIETAKLPSIAALGYGGSTVEDGANHSITWMAYGEVSRELVLRQAGRVLVYIRIRDNPRCLDFEKNFLLNGGGAAHLNGKTVLVLDADDPRMKTAAQKIGVVRIPSLAWMEDSGNWHTISKTHTTTPEELNAFLTAFNTIPSN